MEGSQEYKIHVDLYQKKKKMKGKPKLNKNYYFFFVSVIVVSVSKQSRFNYFHLCAKKFFQSLDKMSPLFLSALKWF